MLLLVSFEEGRKFFEVYLMCCSEEGSGGLKVTCRVRREAE
jgi:hypothetical protein